MRRWVLVCLLSLGVIIAYVDRTNLSVSLASDDFKALFHLTDRDRGMLNSAFFWSYALLQIPAGFLVDRFGVKIPVAVGLVFWCAVSIATAGTSLLWQLLTLRLLLGVGESESRPAACAGYATTLKSAAAGLRSAFTWRAPSTGPPWALRWRPGSSRITAGAACS